MKEKLTKKELQEKVEKLEDEVTNLKFQIIKSDKEKENELPMQIFNVMFFIGFALVIANLLKYLFI